MIKEIYPTNILVKELDIDEAELSVIENWLMAQHQSFLADGTVDHIEYTDGNENIIFNALIKGQCPEMETLVKEMKNAFIELAYSNISSFHETNTDSFILDCEIDSCKINLMKKGFRLGCHTHYSDDGAAVFYFNDIEEKDGGELCLYDPRWQRNYWFAGSKMEKIRPKRGTLVIFPSFIWHEVSHYFGDDDRLALVVNAQVHDAADEVRAKSRATETLL